MIERTMNDKQLHHKIKYPKKLCISLTVGAYAPTPLTQTVKSNQVAFNE